MGQFTLMLSRPGNCTLRSKPLATLCVSCNQNISYPIFNKLFSLTLFYNYILSILFIQNYSFTTFLNYINLKNSSNTFEHHFETYQHFIVSNILNKKCFKLNSLFLLSKQELVFLGVNP